MPRQMTATEAKAKFHGLVDDVAGGDEVEMTKHGRTVARLVPARGGGRLRASMVGLRSPPIAMTSCSAPARCGTAQ